ncbi:hypothetical protein C6P45_003709 [Maudiozyma exigua]|uniref:Protein KRE1 n=1 Tax=Maudiozyma exigua TaxID=34358 RepID=A0A9P7BD66_MAUEX|nr:hypothetical protein C6P45_003709 [Kazachstania exigua]
MLFDKLLITILCSINIVFAAITTQLVTTTNIAGVTLVRTSTFDNAAATNTALNTNTGVQTITYTSTDPNGILLTRTTVTNVGALTASSSTGTSKGTSTGTSTNTVTNTAVTQTGLITSTYTSTDPNGVTLTRTTTYALTSSTSDATGTATTTGTGKSSSSKTSKSTTGSYVNNGRPDPSTSMTPYPLTPVTTLSLDRFYTVTQGTTKVYTSLRARTTIYATVVVSGQTIVRSTTFAQRFSSQYTAVAVPSSGSIGLGSLTGTIGVIKTNMKTTIKYNEADRNLAFNTKNLLGLFILFISLWI